jgi:integrase
MRTQLDDAIQDYRRFRVSMGIAKNTLRGQDTTLNRFLAVNGNIWCHSLTDVHVTRYFEEITKTKQPQSQRNDHAVLVGFFEWARRTKRLGPDEDPMYGRRKPKRVNRERMRIPVSRFPELLDAAEARAPLHRAAMALLLYTLLRDGEVTDLRIRDLDLDSGYLMARIHKTSQEDRVPICQELDQEMRRWLTYYTNSVGPLEPHYYLVPTRRVQGMRGGDGLYDRAKELCLLPESRIPALGKVVNPALADIGFPTKDANGRPMGEGAHTIRRSGARALFDQLVGDGFDGSLRVVQSMLHHASVTQTETYLGITADRRTRDELIRGKRLYAVGGTVTELRSVRDGAEANG